MSLPVVQCRHAHAGGHEGQQTAGVLDHPRLQRARDRGPLQEGLQPERGIGDVQDEEVDAELVRWVHGRSRHVDTRVDDLGSGTLQVLAGVDLVPA